MITVPRKSNLQFMNPNVPTPHQAYTLLVHECLHCFASEPSTHAREWEPACWDRPGEASVAFAGPGRVMGGKATGLGRFRGVIPCRKTLTAGNTLIAKLFLKWFLKKEYWNFKNQLLSFGHYVSKPRLFLICFFPVCVFRSEDPFHYCHSRKCHWSKEQSCRFPCY